MANESLDLFIRLINEKQSKVKSLSHSLLKSLAGEDKDNKKNSASLLLTASNDLKAIVSSKDVPSWLVSLIHYLENFISGNWSTEDFLLYFINIKNAIDTHSWNFEQNTDTPFDFDRIFDHYKSESRLSELFDEIIRILEEIKSSDQIDSLTMMKSLGKVIITLKTNKNGSYFSLNGAWDFLINFLKNYMWAELSKIPVLGTALDALEKTLRETNDEMFLLHTQMQVEMNRVVEADIKHLSGKSRFSFIGYDKSGYVIDKNNKTKLISAV